MYNQFIFEDGSNPYITTTAAEFWRMLKKYCVEMIGEHTFKVYGEAMTLTAAPGKKRTTREKMRGVLRDFAIEWQYAVGEYSIQYSMKELCEWDAFFEEYGKKYGLLREFRENCIC